MTDPEYIYVPEYGYEVTKRIVVSQTPEYIASYNLSRLENGQVIAFAHLDVFDFTPSVLRQMLKDWKTFRPTMPADLYCMAEEDTRVHAHFVKKLGFLHVGDIPCTDGNTRRLYLHRL